jgi:hypothetical protein
MIDLVVLKQQAGIQDNPDQEGLNLFANLIIEACAEHLMNTSDRYRKEYFAQKVLELKNDIYC